MAGVRRYQDFVAWQLAELFQERVVAIVNGSPAASRNYRYRDQLLEAASAVSKDIAEGFLRCAPLVFANFLDYALGSLGEAERRLHDGIQREYFSVGDCAVAFQLARRCLTAMIRLKQSQLRYAQRLSKARVRRPRRS